MRATVFRDQRIGNFDTHFGAAGHFFDVRINESDRAGKDLSGRSGSGDIDFLAGLNPDEVALVSIDLEEFLTFLDVLAFIDVAGHDRASHWGEDFSGDAEFFLAWQFLNLLIVEA